MTDKDLRRLKRSDLIEIIYELRKNEQRLIEDNQKLAALLDERRIKKREAGSIAEAALGLNDVFGAAQRAADQYLAEIKEKYDEADKIISEATANAESMLKKAQHECEVMKKQAEEIYSNAAIQASKRSK